MLDKRRPLAIIADDLGLYESTAYRYGLAFGTLGLEREDNYLRAKTGQLMLRHKITDRQWTVVAPLLSGKATDCGVMAKDNRLFFNAVVWLMRTGVPWADCIVPERSDVVFTNELRQHLWGKYVLLPKNWTV